jgi:serine phosphatase RsbU (regulator of sigma subunit)
VANPGGELFGKRRFMDLIQQTKNFLSDDAVDAMIEQLNAWSGKKEDEAHEDDITLIIFDMM